MVHEVSDLQRVRVGAVANTTTTRLPSAHQISFFDYPDPAAALLALQNHRIDAVVYDRPLLIWLIKQKFAETLQVLPLTFDKQTYGIALPVGQPVARASRSHAARGRAQRLVAASPLQLPRRTNLTSRSRPRWAIGLGVR